MLFTFRSTATAAAKIYKSKLQSKFLSSAFIIKFAATTATSAAAISNACSTTNHINSAAISE